MKQGKFIQTARGGHHMNKLHRNFTRPAPAPASASASASTFLARSKKLPCWASPFFFYFVRDFMRGAFFFLTLSFSVVSFSSGLLIALAAGPLLANM